MKQCPYCLGSIPDAAVKCQHCGEWVDGRGPTGRASGPGSGPLPPTDELGRAANRWVTHSTVMGVVMLILVLLFFFFVWLPGWNDHKRRFDGFEGVPSGLKP